MRTIITTLIAVVLLPPIANGAEPLFADKNLEAAIRWEIYRSTDPAKELEKRALKDLSTFRARGKKIKSLAGIENCINLISLDLANNEIADLSPLAVMKLLQSLDLSRNKVTNIKPVSELVSLQYLKLSKNQVTDLVPLSGLQKLSALYLSDNKLSNITPLAKLTGLASLYMARNQLTDIAPLAKLKRLTSLDLSGNKIADVTPLSQSLPRSYLMLSGNKITDLSPLVTLSEKKEPRPPSYLRLYLSGNPLSDDAHKKQVAQLKSTGIHVYLKRDKGEGTRAQRKEIP